MPELTRSQLVVYAGLACAVLLLGARWIRSSSPSDGQRGGLAFAGEQAESAPAPDAGLEATAGDVVVHVAGEVERPGVYRLPSGSRVTDAIERAGGVSARAAPDSINLAAKLADGQQVVIPASAGPSASGATTATATEGPISLGTATVEQLDTIEGIGPVTAAEIIEFRDQHGGVSSIEDLDQISGIGPATMESLRASLQP